MTERENDIQESYVNTLKTVMQQENLSAQDAIDFIKAGNYVVAGRVVPGFLFPEVKIGNQNLTSPSPYTIIDPDNFDNSGNQISFTTFSLEDAAQFVEGGFEDPTETYGTGTKFTTDFKPAEVATVDTASSAVANTTTDKTVEDKPKPVVSDMPMGSKPIVQQPLKYKQGEDIDKLTTEMEDKTYQQVQDPSQLAQAQAVALKAQQDAAQEYANRQAEKEQNQAKVKQERAQASKEKRVGGQGIVRAKGGIASKPKKTKVMKRGGLASKK